MRSIVIVLAVLAAACASRSPLGAFTEDTPSPAATRGGEDPTASQARLEARVIGLTDEIDRLSRRLSALEQHLGAAPPPESPASPPSPPAGPGRPATARPAASARDVTGILIDARGSVTEGEKRPEGTRHELWRILDLAGATVFSSRDLPEKLRRVVPVFWLAGPAEPADTDTVRTVGENPLALPAAYAEMYRNEDGSEEALFYLDAAAVARLRALPDLTRLLSAGGVAIVLPK